MPRIVEERPYNGALEKIERLGLTIVLDDLRSIISGFTLLLKEETDANGGAAVRRMLDEQFKQALGWVKKQTGDVDWTKCQVINGVRVCIGVEIQFSARSDLIVIDIIHLRKAVTEGWIDAGILVVPSDRLSGFLTDRGPSMSDAKRHVLAAKAEDLPLLVIALEHDGPGPPLPKQEKKARKEPKRERGTRGASR
jgi:hypothetical protein